jgi:hypothetical protein
MRGPGIRPARSLWACSPASGSVASPERQASRGMRKTWPGKIRFGLLMRSRLAWKIS